LFGSFDSAFGFDRSLPSLRSLIEALTVLSSLCTTPTRASGTPTLPPSLALFLISHPSVRRFRASAGGGEDGRMCSARRLTYQTGRSASADLPPSAAPQSRFSLDLPLPLNCPIPSSDAATPIASSCCLSLHLPCLSCFEEVVTVGTRRKRVFSLLSPLRQYGTHDSARRAAGRE
jgi:hypothetical protein